MTNIDPSLYVPIAPDPADPGNWREINRLQRLAEAEGRQFDPDDPYNWKGIAAAQAGQPPANAGTAGTTPAATTPAPGVDGSTATAGTDAAAVARNRALFDLIATTIRDAGLDGLFSIGADGTPSGALWEQITSGVDSQAGLIAWFESTPQFQARFPAIAEARANGLGYVPTPRDVRQYEQTAAEIMRNAGMPSWFFDQPQELQALMGQNISVSELEERLGQAWTTVRTTDPSVTQMFSEFFGVDGDAAMAAFFLDPDRTVASIDRAARTAYTAGMGRNVGLSIDRQLADRMATLPNTLAGIWEDLTIVGRMNRPGGVFEEGITETRDLTAEGEGFESVVFGDGEATSAIERRILERQANSRSSLGGAAITQAGVAGVGRS